MLWYISYWWLILLIAAYIVFAIYRIRILRSRLRRANEQGNDVNASDAMPVDAEAQIVGAEPEIRMADARIISQPHPSYSTQDRPVTNNEESVLPKWYTNMQKSPYSFKI